MKKNTFKKSDAAISLNILTEGSTMKGTFQSDSDIRVSGVILGDIIINGKLVLTTSGRVEGEIRASEVDIAGTVKGNVRVSGRVTLREPSKITGNIASKVLVVEEGAIFLGECHMTSETPEQDINPQDINPNDINPKDRKISRQEIQGAENGMVSVTDAKA